MLTLASVAMLLKLRSPMAALSCEAISATRRASMGALFKNTPSGHCPRVRYSRGVDKSPLAGTGPKYHTVQSFGSPKGCEQGAFSLLITYIVNNHPSPERRALRWDGVDVAKRKDLVRAAPLPAEIQALLDTYVPRNMDRADWDSVESTVKAWFVLAAPQERSFAVQMMLCFARLAHWAMARHMPLDPDELFTPTIVVRFCEHVETTLGKASANEYSYLLNRAGPVVGDSENWIKPARQRGRIKVRNALDSDTELSCISQARHAGPHVLAMCLLGFGAGLDGRWLPHVRGIDVVEIDGWVHVQVPDPDARAIPVLAEYADELSALAASAGEGCLIGGENLVQNRVWALTRKIVITEGRKLFVGEMRSTWFAKHLANNTHLVYLSHITGVKSFARLLAVLEDVQVPDMTDMARHARSA